MTGPEGFAIRQLVLSKGKVQSEAWFDERNQPVPMMEGDVYKVEYTYDKRGNVNRKKYYDQYDRPVTCTEGYSIVYMEYDELNRIIYEKFYGTAGFAIDLADGTVSRRYTYDLDGNVKVTRYGYQDKAIGVE